MPFNWQGKSNKSFGVLSQLALLASFPGLPTVQFLDRLQYAKMEGKGLVHFIMWMASLHSADRGRGQQSEDMFFVLNEQ